MQCEDSWVFKELLLSHLFFGQLEVTVWVYLSSDLHGYHIDVVHRYIWWQNKHTQRNKRERMVGGFNNRYQSTYWSWHPIILQLSGIATVHQKWFCFMMTVKRGGKRIQLFKKAIEKRKCSLSLFGQLVPGKRIKISP